MALVGPGRSATGAAVADAVGEALSPCALQATTAQGLANARWPGRAMELMVGLDGGVTEVDSRGDVLRAWALPQIADEPDAPSAGAAAAGGGASGLRVFLDGAHSPMSMACCLEWFATRSAAALAACGSAPQRRSVRRVLVFNCSHDRNAAELMFPLMWVPWDAVLLCPFDYERPSTARKHAAESVVGSSKMRDVETRAMSASPDSRLGRALASLWATAGERESWTPSLWGEALVGALSVVAPEPAAGAEMGSGAGAEPGASADPLLGWQRTLGRVWQLLREARSLDTPPAPEDDGAHSLVRYMQSLPSSTWDQLPPAPQVCVLPSIAEALRQLRGLAARDDAESPELHVLFTGSLYLIGGALEATGWRAEGGAPPRILRGFS